MKTEPTVPARDREEFDLVRADQLAYRLYGPREREWNETQRAGYFAALETIHADYPQHHVPRAVAA